MDIPWAHSLVVCWVEVFGEVIREIFIPGVPLDVELLVCDLVGDPEELHFYRP